MSRPLRIQYPGAFYHVTARGNERRDIFRNDRDRERFLSYLQGAAHRYGAKFHCYCLMRNHYHLLLETPAGNLSQIMHHINGAYPTYFNIKRKRSGHLFQGRYHAVLVDVDSYALELSRYIHLNPVRAGAANHPADYRWSSYGSFCCGCSAPDWLQTQMILGYFAGTEAMAASRYRAFVEEGLGGGGCNPLKAVVGGTVLGSESFVQMIRDKYLYGEPTDRNLPGPRILQGQRTVEQIKSIVTRNVSDEKLARKLGIHLCHRRSGEKLHRLAEVFGLSESGITQVSRRLAHAAGTDAELSSLIKKLEGELGLYHV